MATEAEQNSMKKPATPYLDRIFETLEEAQSYLESANKVIRADGKVIREAKKIMKSSAPKDKYEAWLKKVKDIDKLFK